MDESEHPTPEHPPVEPDKPENLALHFGRMEAEHQEMRRDWELHKTEMQSLRELVVELQQALTTVEETAEQIMEESPQEATLDEEAEAAHPAHATSPESRKPHFMARVLTGS